MAASTEQHACFLSVLKNFHSGERIQEVTGWHAGFAGYVWTKGESVKKTRRIKKYPDTCGWGLGRGLKNIRICLNGALKIFGYVWTGT